MWSFGWGFRRQGLTYLLGGCEAGKGAEVGVCDEHGLREQACVRVLGHLRLVAVEGWEERTQMWLPGPFPEDSALWEVGMGQCLGIQLEEMNPLSSHHRDLLC